MKKNTKKVRFHEIEKIHEYEYPNANEPKNKSSQKTIYLPIQNKTITVTQSKVHQAITNNLRKQNSDQE